MCNIYLHLGELGYLLSDLQDFSQCRSSARVMAVVPCEPGPYSDSFPSEDTVVPGFRNVCFGTDARIQPQWIWCAQCVKPVAVSAQQAQEKEFWGLLLTMQSTLRMQRNWVSENCERVEINLFIGMSQAW